MRKIRQFALSIFTKPRKEKKELGTNSTMLKIWSDCRPPSAEVYSISKGAGYGESLVQIYILYI